MEVSHDFIKNIFSLANIPIPDEINQEKLDTAIEKIKSRLNSSSSPGVISSTAGSSDADPVSKSVLVVDDLGIVTMQLESVLKKIGFDVTVSKELFDAIEKFKTKDFGYAVVDLFIPTDREGYILIDEIKKLSLLCKLNTKIIVMTASNKKEYRDNCLNRGANHFVEKAPGWQRKIVEICLGREEQN